MLLCLAENVEELREKQKAISAEEEVVQQQGRHERAQVEALKADLDKLHAHEQVLPPESQRLEQQLTQSRALVTRSEAILEQAQRGMEHKLGELDRGISLYKARLGLAFDKVGDDRLRLTFTCIDPTDPERAFCLEVCVTVGDHYVVQSCEPTLTELPGLVHTLNASNDFSAFVRAVRKGFQKLVTG